MRSNVRYKMIQNQMQKNILITGGAGFIDKNDLLLLANRYEKSGYGKYLKYILK